MPSPISSMLNGSGLGTVAKPKLLDDATRAKLGLPRLPQPRQPRPSNPSMAQPTV